jgi:hypothetical protein
MKANRAILAVLSLLLIALVSIGTNKAIIELKHSYVINRVEINIVQIKGHEYIITSTEKGGVSTIHSESCNCKIIGQ